MAHKVLFACATAVAAVSFGPQAQAWHAQGHLMTAEIAWQTMTPGARCRAAKILRGRIYGLFPQGPDLPPVDEKMFVTAATWPDRIKQDPRNYHSGGEKPKGPPASRNIGSADKLTHNYWHYVDYAVPDDPAKPPPPVNAEERIGRFVKVLGSKNTSLDLKAYDLAWLIHLAGDVHQPLHTATQYGSAFEHGDDAGGNAVKLSWPDGSLAPNPSNPPRELHGYWDAAPGNDVSDLAEAVRRARTLTPAPADRAADLDVSHWIAESRALADTAAYVAPVMRGQTGKFVLNDNYRREAVRITQERVALGGARLGNLLNATLTWPSPACDG